MLNKATALLGVVFVLACQSHTSALQDVESSPIPVVPDPQKFGTNLSANVKLACQQLHLELEHSLKVHPHLDASYKSKALAMGLAAFTLEQSTQSFDIKQYIDQVRSLAQSTEVHELASSNEPLAWCQKVLGFNGEAKLATRQLKEASTEQSQLEHLRSIFYYTMLAVDGPYSRYRAPQEAELKQYINDLPVAGLHFHYRADYYDTRIPPYLIVQEVDLDSPYAELKGSRIDRIKVSSATKQGSKELVTDAWMPVAQYIKEKLAGSYADLERLLNLSSPDLGLTFQVEYELKGARQQTELVSAAIVQAKAAFGQLLNQNGADLAYIRLMTLNDERAVESFKSAWLEIRQQSAQPITDLILDLRGNYGGLSTEATHLLELFLPKGSLVCYGAYKEGNQDWQLKPKITDYAWPDLRELKRIVVLIDRHSASGAEIVAAAIRYHKLGLVVGEASYGKFAGGHRRQIPAPLGGELNTMTFYVLDPGGQAYHLQSQQILDFAIQPPFRPQSGQLRTMARDLATYSFDGQPSLPALNFNDLDLSYQAPQPAALLDEKTRQKILAAKAKLRSPFCAPQSSPADEIQDCLLDTALRTMGLWRSFGAAPDNLDDI